LWWNMLLRIWVWRPTGHETTFLNEVMLLMK
jgi:hypothetical protein